MATIMVQASAWNALTADQQADIRYWASFPAWLEPVVYVDEAGVEWVIGDDHRLTEEQIALIAAYVEDPASIPPRPQEPPSE